MRYLHRKNYLPAFIVNALLWLSWLAVVFFFSPQEILPLSLFGLEISFPVNIFLFFLTLVLSLSLTFAFFFANSRRGFLASIFVFGLLFFRLLKILHWWNVLILFVFVLWLEYYFWKKASQDKNRKLPRK